MSESQYYIDSSVLLGMLFDDQETEFLKKMPAAQTVSSHLLEAEVLSACFRDNIETHKAVSLLNEIDLITLDRSLVGEYNLIFQSGYLKGADAFHLACALFLDPTCKNLTFVTADKPQAIIAKKLGFKII